MLHSGSRTVKIQSIKVNLQKLQPRVKLRVCLFSIQKLNKYRYAQMPILNNAIYLLQPSHVIKLVLLLG